MPDAEDASEDGLRDPEDLQPLLPPEMTLRNYAQADDNLETQRTFSDAWESELMEYNRQHTTPDQYVQDDDSDAEPPTTQNNISVKVAFSHSIDFRYYALQTGNPELLELMTKVQDILKDDQREHGEAVSTLKQSKILLFSSNMIVE